VKDNKKKQAAKMGGQNDSRKWVEMKNARISGLKGY
jgi:hypothetical protein